MRKATLFFALLVACASFAPAPGVYIANIQAWADGRYLLKSGNTNGIAQGGDTREMPDTIGQKGNYAVNIIADNIVHMKLDPAAGKDTLYRSTVLTSNATASTPGFAVLSTPYLSGNVSTNASAVLIGTTLNASYGSNSTMFLVNAPSGFIGNLFDFQVNGASQLRTNSIGQTTIAGTIASGGITSSSNIIAGTASYLGLTNKLQLKASTSGNMQIYATDGTTPANITTVGNISSSGYLDLAPIAAPSPPTSGMRIYVDASDGKLKVKNVSGTVTNLTP
jgi:hypothetical protein